MAMLSNRKIAVLFTDGVEEVELTKPVAAVKEAGAVITFVSLKTGKVQALEEDVKPAGTYQVDTAVADADPTAFDGLLLPGGTTNPDALRQDEDAIAFVKSFSDAGKPIASICHVPGC